ncbi:beta-microseminoprotein-like [Mizuhopecten yessoensis]|uniref:Beta-microseminoprotein n=1 Tax=Mizuhopecten yessoensis TaxID=6573 RepID=A0A210R466_MIZYE|nr:beta-microseminoprotein-like [Mizuhopecten yessoensis]OWF55745.1 Beta-microseminoprotein [Mizuhopecten yessoensis]
MATYTLLAAIGSLYFLVGSATASCSISGPLTESLMSGKVRKTCLYNDVRLEIGSEFDTSSCEHCSCTESGLSCCGIGYRAGAIQTFPGCEIIGDGCDPLSVKTCDNTIGCETGRPIRNKLYERLRPSFGTRS